jgi:pimeloyl-ACP methyl ester carboxylesterase
MECQINEVAVHYVEYGTGMPLVALHGAGVDYREIEAAVEAIVPATGYRRIYPDLPGMGRSTADGVTCNDDVVKLLGHFIECTAQKSVLLLAHSYGAYLARGVAAQRPDLVLGLALLSSAGERPRNVPAHEVVRHDADAYEELEPAQQAGSTSTSSCAHRRPLAARATTFCRARRWLTKLRWSASSPDGRSTSGQAPSRRRP